MRTGANSIGHTYRFTSAVPTFPYGFGLDYTSWEMAWVAASLPAASVPIAKLESGISVSVTVTPPPIPAFPVVPLIAFSFRFLRNAVSVPHRVWRAPTLLVLWPCTLTSVARSS